MADDILSQIVEELLFLTSRQDFSVSVLTTVLHAVAGLSIALAVLVPIVLVTFIRRWEKNIGTASAIFNTIPALAWVLLLVASFGVFSPLPVVFTIALTVLPVLLPTASNPVRVFISRLIELARLVNASSLRSFRVIILPAYLPLVFSYVRAGLGFAVKMAMVAEAFTASSGLGSRMMLAYSLGNVPQLIALSTLAVIFVIAIDLVAGRMLGWRKEWSS